MVDLDDLVLVLWILWLTRGVALTLAALGVVWVALWRAVRELEVARDAG